MTVVGVASRPLQYMKAIADAALPTGTKATCWAIASFADNDTGRAYPSLKVLASASGLTQAVLSKHTARAEEAGYLRKERRHNSSIVYTITTPVLGMQAVSEVEHSEGLPVDVVANVGWAMGSPTFQEGPPF